MITAGNDAGSSAVVTTVAVPQDWLTVHAGWPVQELRRSTRPVALVVVGQLDPYENPEVAQGLLEVLDSCRGKVFLHRTDMTAIEVLGRDGLGASIGGDSVPCGTRSRRAAGRRNGGARAARGAPCTCSCPESASSGTSRNWKVVRRRRTRMRARRLLWAPADQLQP